MKRKSIMLLVLGLLLAALAVGCNKASTTEKTSSSASASKEWPTGTVSIFVPGQAGANLDIKARLVAKYLTPELGKTVVVENRPGAGGITACTQFLAEEPNSNSIQYVAASNFAVAPIYNDVEYQPDDFITVTGFDEVENGFFVSSKLGITTLDELKEYGKDKIVKFASAGVGNDSFLVSKILMNELGLQSDSINGDGFTDAVVNVLSGNAEVCYCALNTGYQYVQDGSLIPLAVYSADDYTGYADIGYPSVPALKTLGYDIEYSTITWFALRKGTDQAAVEKLNNALAKVYANPDFQAEFAAAGFVMMDDTSTEAVSKRVENMIEDCKSFADRI